MHHLQKTYKPEDLPVHIICPSLVGFGFSSYPPRHDTMTNVDCAALNDGLMRSLGFDKYIAQGGDIGSFVSRLMGEKHDSCVGKYCKCTPNQNQEALTRAAVHLNMFAVAPPKAFDGSQLDEFDQRCLARLNYFGDHEFAYNEEHGTKTATIAAVVESSPVAMLAWYVPFIRSIRGADSDPFVQDRREDAGLV